MTWSSSPISEQQPDGDRLLADVEVEKAADLLALIGAQRALLEAADAHHLPEQIELGFGVERRVGGGLAEVLARGVGGGLGLGGGAVFLGHRGSWKLGNGKVSVASRRNQARFMPVPAYRAGTTKFPRSQP
jgi:hypothetical protein